MASKRKFVKSVFSPEDKTLNHLQCANSSMKNKIPKLTHDEAVEGNSRIQTKRFSKEKRVESNPDVTQKIFNVVDQQLTKRNKSNQYVLNSLLDKISQMKDDYEVLKQNGQTLEHLMSTYMNYIKVSASIRKQNLRKLEELYNAYKIQCEEMDSEENSENMKLTGILIKNLYETIIVDAKCSE